MRRRGQGSTVDASHHANGHLAQSPLSLFVIIGVCGIAFYLFSQLQIASTEQFIFDILQTGIQIQPGMTGEQAQQFLNGQLTTNQTIGAAIGWSVQIALFLLSFPPDATLLLMHRKFNVDISTSFSEKAANYAKWQKFCMVTLIGGDIVTDFFYVMQTHVTISMHWFIPTIQGLTMGILLVGLLYPISICFITVFVGKFMLMSIDALIDRLKGA